MKLRRVSMSMFVLAISFFVLSCGQQKDRWQGTIEEVDGVTVIKNPLEPMYDEDVLELEEELSIGEAEGREEYMFSRVFSIVVDDLENIYVSDLLEAHIKVFDKNGQYLKTIGKKGQGPDEFQVPSDLAIILQNEILVNDSRARQIKFFSLEGRQIRQISSAKYLGFNGPRVDSTGEIIAGVSVMGEGVFTRQIIKFTEELEEKVTISTMEISRYPEIIPFSPRQYWVVNKKDQIVWAVPNKYEFHIVSPDGTLVKTIMKEYIPVPIMEEDKDKWLKDIYGGEQNVPSDVKIVWSEHQCAFQHISIDEQERIFIQTFEKEDDTGQHFYDVFDSEGKYIARTLLNSQLHIWKNDKLYTIEEDEDGYQFVKRYKVTWNY